MKEGPDISRLASLIGDPARANMLTALMDGRALTASELANHAGITKQTASAHLGKLIDGGLLSREIQGRHHYFRLDGNDIAAALEALMGVAAKRSGGRTRTGPKDPALRKARICYDHLAGEMGVLLFDRFLERGWLDQQEGDLAVTAPGQAALADFGLALEDLARASRRKLCRSCLDWSMRRHHLAGSLGQALLQRFEALKWARRLPDTRIIAFTPPGERAFLQWLGDGAGKSMIRFVLFFGVAVFFAGIYFLAADGDLLFYIIGSWFLVEALLLWGFGRKSKSGEEERDRSDP